MAIDLVCGMIVDEKSVPAKTRYGGSNYYFCATYCREAFDREPQKFVELPALWAGLPGHAVASGMRANESPFSFVSLDRA